MTTKLPYTRNLPKYKYFNNKRYRWHMAVASKDSGHLNDVMKAITDQGWYVRKVETQTGYVLYVRQYTPKRRQ